MLSTEEAEFVAAAWNGSTYLVTWPDANGIGGAFVSSDGVIDRVAHVAIASPQVRSWYPIAHAGTFVIVTEQQEGALLVSRATVVGGESSVIVTRPISPTPGPIAAASDGAALMFGYDRIDDENGHVSRVFLDPRVTVNRRRIAR